MKALAVTVAFVIISAQIVAILLGTITVVISADVVGQLGCATVVVMDRLVIW